MPQAFITNDDRGLRAWKGVNRMAETTNTHKHVAICKPGRCQPNHAESGHTEYDIVSKTSSQTTCMHILKAINFKNKKEKDEEDQLHHLVCTDTQCHVYGPHVMLILNRFDITVSM